MYYFEKMKNHLFNWINYSKEHLLRIIFIGIILFLCCYVLTIFPKLSENGEQYIFIYGITLSNWSTWLGILAIAGTAIWAIYQYDKNKTSKQQEKASNIAKSFSDRLALECSIIYYVISNSEIFHLLELNIKKYESFKIFNTNEIRNIYNDDNYIEKYNKTKKESDLNQIYYRLLEARISFKSFDELIEENKQYSVEEARKLFILDNSYLPFKFSALVTKVLNELEYLCMSLSSQAAGSKYVYQSLHQVFLRTIRLLCVEIAMSNNNHYSDKYYTSIIHVYNDWTQLYTLDLEKEKKQKEKVNKILNPKVKTV